MSNTDAVASLFSKLQGAVNVSTMYHAAVRMLTGTNDGAEDVRGADHNLRRHHPLEHTNGGMSTAACFGGDSSRHRQQSASSGLPAKRVDNVSGQERNTQFNCSPWIVLDMVHQLGIGVAKNLRHL